MHFFSNEKSYSSGKTSTKSNNIVKVSISSERKFYDPDYPVGTPEDPFEKSKIEEQITARLAKRNSVTSEYGGSHAYPQQGGSSLCGPAAFMYALLEDQPNLYKQYIKDLWDNGEARLGKLYIKPSEDARHPSNYTRFDTQNNVLRPRVPPIDWISLASLRDSENTMLDYDSPDAQVAGITRPGALSDWFEKLGAAKVFSNVTLFSSSNLRDIVELSNYVSPSYHVVTLISSGMLYRGTGTSKDHWIVWTGKPTVESTKKAVTGETPEDELVTLELFSWGEVKNHLKSTLTLKQFKKHLHGGMVFNRIP